MIELQPDAVGVLEQQRIVAGRPIVFARRADDVDAERTEEAVQFVDVGALAGAEAEMMQADATLRESGSGVFGRGPTDTERGASADAVEEFIAVDHRLQAEKRQQLAVEFA